MSGRPEDSVNSSSGGDAQTSSHRSIPVPHTIAPTHVEVKIAGPRPLEFLDSRLDGSVEPARSTQSGTSSTPVPVGPDAVVTDTQISNANGLVKWFDPRKGFGFIVGPQGQDVFAHYTTIDGEGFRVLKDSSTVVYDAVNTDKGWKATRIRRQETVEVVVPPRRGYSRTPRQ